MVEHTVEPRVEHLAEQRRFVLRLPEGTALVDYRLHGPTVFEMNHTFTPPLLRGRGVASRLVTGALDICRANGWTVIPACWYVDQFMEKHAEYRDLIFNERSAHEARAENPPKCDI